MATAPVLPYISVDEYLRTSYEPYSEYVDGTLIPKTMPGREHGALIKLLYLALARAEQEFPLDAVSERHLRVSPTRIRIADFAAFTLIERNPAALTAPLFTVEVVSQGEPWDELMAKVSDHLAMGVGTVIVADPRRRTVVIARQNELLHQLAAPLRVSIDVPGRGTLTLDFDEMFAKLG